MKTEAIFLEDAYTTEMNATILESIAEGNNGRWRMILDRTVFYPMGGGQPTDQGQLICETWSADVYQVLTKDGEIWHFVQTTHPLPIDKNVHGILNWERRYKNMRIHSAGHIVDFAMYLLGYSPKQVTPIKGDHGKKPFIIYAGVLDVDIRTQLEDMANDIVQRDLLFTSMFMAIDELREKAIYLQPGLPSDKKLRALTLEGIGTVADGGTQVQRTSEVGRISILGITEKDGLTTISYSC